MIKLILPFIALLMGFSAFSQDSEEPTDADYQAISDALQSKDGLVLEVHGGDFDHGLFVLTWRDKKNFFKYVQLPMTGRNYEAKKTIAGLNRHDSVRLWGEFDAFLPEGQRHIDVDKIVIEKTFQSACEDEGLPPFEHKVRLPDDLKGLKEIIVKVHGVVGGGQVLMVEYLDTLIPVIVQEPTRVQDFFKGDKIKIQFSIAQYPVSPVHLMLNTGADAVQMIKSIQEVNPKKQGDVMSLCGPLVLYKESPVITSNVFALESNIGDGYDWTFTLFNPDKKIFASLRDKMQAVWDANKSTIRCGRNYVYNPNIRVCASGQGNDEDPSQANPQIFVDKADNISLEVVP